MKKRMKSLGLAALLLAAITMSATLASCSDDTTPEGGGGDSIENEGIDQPVSYTKETGSGETYNLANSDGVLFTDKDGSVQIGNGDQHFCFTGNRTIKRGTYVLKGWVYVTRGAKLTIEPGTIIKGDKTTASALIVEPGGQANLEGTSDQPIVMTSAQPKGQRKPGDWGGLIVCGEARNNQGTMQIEGGPKTKHGGANDDDNSGSYRYLRVEFAGYPFKTDQEINGITFGSVGRGTVVDHVQVSYSNDDSYEWFGGSMNAKHLIAYKGWDDEFDTDNGFSGHIQFGLSIRDPRIADQSQANGFESDNNADGTEIDPYTNATFSNLTFIGPSTAKNKAAGFQNTVGSGDSYITAGDLYPDNGSRLGKFQAAMQIRRSSKLNCYNSLAVGYPIGLIIDGEKGATVRYAKEGAFHLRNLVFAGMDVLGSDNNKYYKDELYDPATKTYDASQPSFSHSFFLSEANKQMTEAELLLSDPAGTGQNYAPATGSPLLSGGNFDGVSSSFLDKTATYIGAFKDASDNWLAGWTNFNPQETDY